MDAWVRTALLVCVMAIATTVVVYAGEALWGLAGGFEASSGGALIRDVLAMLVVWGVVFAGSRGAQVARVDSSWGRAAYRLTLVGLLLVGALSTLLTLGGVLAGGYDVMRAPEAWASFGILLSGVLLMAVLHVSHTHHRP